MLVLRNKCNNLLTKCQCLSAITTICPWESATISFFCLQTETISLISGNIQSLLHLLNKMYNYIWQPSLKNIWWKLTGSGPCRCLINTIIQNFQISSINFPFKWMSKFRIKFTQKVTFPHSNHTPNKHLNVPVQINSPPWRSKGSVQVFVEEVRMVIVCRTFSPNTVTTPHLGWENEFQS